MDVEGLRGGIKNEGLGGERKRRDDSCCSHGASVAFWT